MPRLRRWLGNTNLGCELGLGPVRPLQLALLDPQVARELGFLARAICAAEVARLTRSELDD